MNVVKKRGIRVGINPVSNLVNPLCPGDRIKSAAGVGTQIRQATSSFAGIAGRSLDQGAHLRETTGRVRNNKERKVKKKRKSPPGPPSHRDTSESDCTQGCSGHQWQGA